MAPEQLISALSVPTTQPLPILDGPSIVLARRLALAGRYEWLTIDNECTVRAYGREVRWQNGFCGE